MGFEDRSYNGPGGYSREQRFWNGVAYYDATVPNQYSDKYQITRLSYTTPNFKTRQANGTLPENTFRYHYTSYTACTFTQDTVIVYLNGNVYRQVKWGTIASTFNFTIPSIFSIGGINIKNDAIAKALQKVKSVEWDAAVFAGELGETFRMFRGFAESLIQAERAARRGDWMGVRRALGLDNTAGRHLSNIWLLVNYGIAPLVNDLIKAAKAAERGMLKEGYTLVKTRSSFSDSTVVVSGNTVYHWHTKIDASVRLKYSVTSSTRATLTSLGLTNPFVVGWELTKLSFVIDWAIGIGTWLSNLDASHGKTFSGGSTTVFSRTTCSARFHSHNASGVPGSYASITKTQDFEKVMCNREQLSGFPVQKLPVVKDPSGLFHLLTSLALIRQRS